MSSRKKAAIKKAKAGNRQIALERIQLLFAEARKAFNTNSERSNRYVDLARRIGMRYRVSIPTSLKRKTCNKCRHYIVPGKNCRVRLKSGTRLVICGDCGAVMRYPYRKKKSL